MPRNGSGGYSPPAGQPVVSGTAISSTVFNALVTDIGNELTKSICTDGQTPMTANLPMGNNRITGLAAGVSASDAARFDQVSGVYLPLTGGTLSGAVTFASSIILNNNTTFLVKDFGGTNRQLFNFAADNTLNWTVPGGSSWNVYSQSGSGPIWSLSNTGIVSQKAALVLENGVAVQSKDGGAVVRSLIYMAGNTVVQSIAGGTSIQWFNQALSTVVASLSNAGDFAAVTVTQTSDERKKENWQAITDAQLDALASMKHAGTFDWIDGSGPSVGGSAQEIQAIVPEAVAVADDEQKSLSVNYGGLNFAILQAMLRRQKAAV